MATQSLAQREIERFWGGDALNDTVWQDVRLFEATTTAFAAEYWDFGRLEQQDWYSILYARTDDERERFDQACGAVAHKLANDAGVETRARWAGAWLLHPQFWWLNRGRASYDNDYYRDEGIRRILRSVAERCVGELAPPDWPARIAQRLYDLAIVGDLGSDRYGRSAAGFDDCIRYLFACDESTTSQPIATLLEALGEGRWEAAWQAITQLAGREQPIAADEVDEAYTWVKEAWQDAGPQFATTLLARLDMEEQLSMFAFRRLLEAMPSSLPAITKFLHQRAVEGDGHAAPRSPWLFRLTERSFVTRLQRLVDEALGEMVADFRPESWPALCQIEHLSGGQYLLRLAEEVEQRGLAGLPKSSYGYWYAQQTAETVLATLLGKLERRGEDDGAALAVLLRRAGAAGGPAACAGVRERDLRRVGLGRQPGIGPDAARARKGGPGIVNRSERRRCTARCRAGHR